MRSFLRPLIGRRALLIAAAMVLLVVYAVSFLFDEPLRQRLERQMNASLVGYTAHIRAVRFHPFNFALTLKDTRIVQDRSPKPPVADLPRLDASVHWRALLHLRLVADFRFDRPKVHVDRTKVAAEANDRVPVEDKGWQQALESIYPLKINEFVIREGEITYVEDKQSPPLHIDHLNFRATNIRNVRSRERTYPSEIQLTGRIFESGRLTLDGNADFMAEPYAAVKAAVEVADMRLDPVKPVLERYNLIVAKGRLSMKSEVEYGPKVKNIAVQTVTIHGLDAGYVNRAAHAAEAEQLREKTAEVAKDVSNDPGMLITVRRVQADGARVRFVDETRDPAYTLEVTDAALRVDSLSNQAKRPPAEGELSGRFMGSGPMKSTFVLRPEVNGPNFDVGVQIEDTDLVKLNDLFRAYGDFDVSAGRFSLYTEIKVHDRRIEGYVKPLFADMKVYDRTQDKHESVMHQVYEGMIGGVAKLLENHRRDEVATKATIEGPVDDPKMSTLQIIVRLIQNAFFRAILPGFEEEARGRA